MVAKNIQENPENPSESDNAENVNKIPVVRVELLLGVGLESSFEDEYEEPSSKKEIVVGPENPDFGCDDECFADNDFTLYTRMDVCSLQRWRAFVREWRSSDGFLNARAAYL